MLREGLDSQALRRIYQKNDISWVGVFGSVARGEETSKSDIDLLVRFSKPKSLLALIRVERELSRTVGKKVDLLTEAAISPYIKDRIFKDLKVVYEAG